jgi:two-component system chemotaxis response regulator CheY
MLRKILIIDDSELVRALYHFALKRYSGTKVVDAANGVEALKKLSEEEDIDLIILDINMPLMDGLTFLDVRSRAGIYNYIPVIIVSTEGTEEAVIAGLKKGAKGYVTKPFKPADLIKLIDKITSPVLV